MNLSKPTRMTAVAAVFALGLTACGGGGDDGSSSSSSESPTGQPGGTYTAELTEPTFLAPASNCYESECSAILKLINDPLVTVDFESGGASKTDLLLRQTINNGGADLLHPQHRAHCRLTHTIQLIHPFVAHYYDLRLAMININIKNSSL